MERGRSVRTSDRDTSLSGITPSAASCDRRSFYKVLFTVGLAHVNIP